MAGVHGLVYVMAGAIVVVASLALGLEDQQGFVFLFYVALAALAYGMLKVIFGAWKYHSMHKRTARTMEKHLGKAHEEISKKHPSFKDPQHHRKGQRFCWSCGSRVTPEDRFCAKCGARLT